MEVKKKAARPRGTDSKECQAFDADHADKLEGFSERGVPEWAWRITEGLSLVAAVLSLIALIVQLVQ